MRRSIALLFLASGAIWATGNTCTLADGGSGAACHSGTCSLSAIAADTGHHNWTGNGCTGNGYMPSADYIVIPNGFTLTADQPWIVGNYGVPPVGYVYGVTGLPTGGFSGSCTATFSGGTSAYNPAIGECTISGGNVTAFTLDNHGSYADGTPPTVTFTGSGGGSGTGTVQFIAGGGAAAVALNDTGVLYVSAAVTARGSIMFNGGWTTGDALIGNAGGSLTFDSSGASNPTATRYSWTAAGFGGQRHMRLNGTSSQHFTVTSHAGGANAFFNAQGDTVCCGLIATYTDFSNLGDSLFEALFLSPNGNNVTYDVQHSTFTGMAPIRIGATSNSVVRHDYNVHMNPSRAADFSVYGTSALATGGVREVIGNVFAAYFQNNIGAAGVTVTGNYFGVPPNILTGYNDPWASFSGNFLRILNPGGTAWAAQGDVANSYFYWDYDYYNPHWIGAWTSSSQTATLWSGVVFDAGGDTGGGDGNTLMHNASGGHTVTVTNTITTPDAGSLSSSTSLANTLYGTATSGTWAVDHNTVMVSDGPGGQGAAQVEGAEAGAHQYAEIKSNIIWSNLNLIPGYNPSSALTIIPQGFKLYDGLGTQLDVVSPSGADYNVGWQTLTGDNGTGFAHSGNGYVGNFSATPGTHDLSANPGFADTTRNLMTFDYYYLGHHYSDWQSSHVYSVGDQVTHPISWFFGGANINYRCIVAHTSDSTTEPGAARYHSTPAWVPNGTRGANWRTYWEPASLHQLRQGVAARTSFTDGAIGCAGCTIIDALRNWVFTGYTPANPALWCAGHDAETIGAVPFCGKGRAIAAALGGI